MTFQQRSVVRILFAIAKFMAPTEWEKEIESLGTHIHYAAVEDARELAKSQPVVANPA